MMKQKSFLPITALIIANILWGFNSPLIKMGLATIPVPVFVSIRFVIATLVLLPFAVRTWKPIKRKDSLSLTFSSLLFIGLSSSAQNWGLSKTSAINSAIIWLLGPLLLLLFSASLLREKLNLRTVLGITVAIAGSLIIIVRPAEAGSPSSLTGNLLIVTAVFSSIISTIISKPVAKKVSPYQLTFLNFLPGTILVTIYAFTKLPNWDVRATSAESVKGLIWSTIAILLANFLFFYALQHKKAQEIGVYQYMQMAVTIVAAWLLLGEQLTVKFALGGGLVLLGVYLAEFARPLKLTIWRLPTLER